MTSGRAPVSEAEAIEQVALGSRIVVMAGYEDLTLGHVSVRGSEGNAMFIKRKGMSLSQVTPDDVVRVGLDDPEALVGPLMHLEAVMHLETYKARPDVGCIVHGHPIFATALGATGSRLEMVSHDSVLFHDGIGRYDESADLITTQAQGRKVAEALGQHRAVLLRNHGVMLVGQDVRWAMLAALTLERAIRLQSAASALGSIKAIPEAEAAAMFYEKYQDRFLDEYWQNWVKAIQ